MGLDFGALGLGDKIGIGLGVSSLVTGLIGDQSAANTERYRAKNAALNFEHQRDMAQLNKRILESQAQHIGRAYNKQIQIRSSKGLKYFQMIRDT